MKTSEDVLDELSVEVKLLGVEFFEHHCKRCLVSGCQSERKCARLYGHQFYTCEKKQAYIDRKLREKKEEAMSLVVSELLDRHFEREEGGLQYSFPLDIIG